MGATDALGGSDVQRARLLHGGCWLAAGVALGVLTAAGQPLAGAAAFAIGAVAALAVRFTAAGDLYDERDESVQQAAASTTLAIVGIASAVVFPTLTALYGLGHFEWGPATAAIAIGVAALYVLYALVTLVEKYRRR